MPVDVVIAIKLKLPLILPGIAAAVTFLLRLLHAYLNLPVPALLWVTGGGP